MRILILVLTLCLIPAFCFSADAMNKKLTPQAVPASSKIKVNPKINSKNMMKLEFSDSAVFEEITLQTDDQGYWYYNLKIKNTGKGTFLGKNRYINCSESAFTQTLLSNINEGQIAEFKLKIFENSSFKDEKLQCVLGSSPPHQGRDKKYVHIPRIKNKVTLQDFTFNKNSKRWKATVRNTSSYTQLVSVYATAQTTNGAVRINAGSSKKTAAPGQTVFIYAVFERYREDVMDLNASIGVQKYFGLGSRTIRF